MKKSAFILIFMTGFILLSALSFFIGYNISKVIVRNIVVTNNPVVTSTNQTYYYLPYNFKFSYSADFGFTSQNYANLDDKIVQLELPQSVYPKTNFGDAGFSISVGFAKNIDDCLKLSPPEGEGKFDTSTLINGINFFRADGSGAGAGNFYESRIYRTLNGSACLEIVETMHTANIGNFTPGTVVEVNKKPIWDKLDSILNSFHFVN